jgi:hypothetical protein
VHTFSHSPLIAFFGHDPVLIRQSTMRSRFTPHLTVGEHHKLLTSLSLYLRQLSRIGLNLRPQSQLDDHNQTAYENILHWNSLYLGSTVDVKRWPQRKEVETTASNWKRAVKMVLKASPGHLVGQGLVCI